MTVRRSVLTLFSLIFGVVVALLLAEGALRLLGVQSKLVYQPNPYYGWSHTPHDTFEWETEGRRLDIHINSLGLRDTELGYDKPENTTRILLLGDSFIEALQVEPADSLSEQLELRLNGLTPGRRFEVINAGVSGFGTDNALLYYRHKGVLYHPDLVLLALYIGNDVRNNWYRLENLDAGGSRKPYFDLTDDGQLVLKAYPFEAHSSRLTRLKVFLNRHVVFYSFLRDVRDRLRHRDANNGGTAGNVPLDLQLFQREPPAEWERAWQVTAGILDKLRDEVAGQGARLVVAIVPTRFQVHPEHWQSKLADRSGLDQVGWDLEAPNRRLNSLLSELGIEHVDLLPSLRARAGASRGDLYYASDGHWNEMGHRAAADALYDQIAAQLAVANSPTP